MLHPIAEFIKSAVVEQIVRDPLWATVAIAGQLTFGSRFLIQWICSEYRQKSHIPNIFWHLSLIGSVILLAYSIHIKNPIFMAGFSVNMLIYLRNLHLIHKASKPPLVE